MEIVDKNLLREKYKNKRKALEIDQKNALDLEITARLLMTKEYRNAKTILTYVSLDNEIDTIRFINAAFANKKMIAVPKCKDKTMKFYFIKSFDDLEKGSFGILEPKEGLEEVTDFDNSLCITPAYCIDFLGHRVGKGAGYYDKFFSNGYNGTKLGLVYTDAVLPKINFDEYDVPLDIIVTDTYLRYIK